VRSGGLRLIVLLAVLVQYTPLRVCALERVAVGSSCHDWHADVGAGESHAAEQRCGSSTAGGGGAGATGGEHQCVCAQPKVDAQHNPQTANAAPDWANLSVVVAVCPASASPARIPALPDPDPNRATPATLQFPLLT